MTNLPPSLRSIQATGLDLAAIADLTIKVLYTRGVMRGQEISDALKLPFSSVIDQALEVLRSEHLVDIRGAADFSDGVIRYMVSRSGRIRVQDLMDRNQYIGPAPVTLEAYSKMVKAQSMLGQTVAQETLRQALGHLVLSNEIVDQLGPAIGSGRSIFIYGNAGDGKTSIGLSLGKLFSGAIWIPYAIDVQGQTIKVFDPLRHQTVLKKSDGGVQALPTRKGLLSRLGGKAGDMDASSEVMITESYDERWVLVRRPLIVAGGELTLKNLDLVYDPTVKYYEAPQQMKANGGVFLLDDLGRQHATAREILNRWTVPLEKRIDYLNLAIGYKFEVPFDALVIFATNLNPTDLVDEAYMRRLRYKVHIPDPTWDEFREIVKREAVKHIIPYSEPGVQYLIEKHYVHANRRPRGVHPRDLLDQLVDIARFSGVMPTMSPELLDRACEAYFLREEPA